MSARAQLYYLLAQPWGVPETEGWDEVCSGAWAANVAGLIHELGLGLTIPDTLRARPEEVARREHSVTFHTPGGLRPIESVYKPWTSDPTAQVAFGHEKGWLYGDSAAHMRALFESLDIQVPPEFTHAPDHLALELEFMGMLVESGDPEQQALFRQQHLDWLDELVAESERLTVPAFYRDLVRLTQALVALDAS